MNPGEADDFSDFVIECTDGQVPFSRFCLFKCGTRFDISGKSFTVSYCKVAIAAVLDALIKNVEWGALNADQITQAYDAAYDYVPSVVGRIGASIVDRCRKNIVPDIIIWAETSRHAALRNELRQCDIGGPFGSGVLPLLPASYVRQHKDYRFLFPIYAGACKKRGIPLPADTNKVIDSIFSEAVHKLDPEYFLPIMNVIFWSPSFLSKNTICASRALAVQKLEEARARKAKRRTQWHS